MVSIPVGASWQNQSWCLHDGDTVKPAFKEHGTCLLYLEACDEWTATQKNNKNSIASQKTVYTNRPICSKEIKWLNDEAV